MFSFFLVTLYNKFIVQSSPVLNFSRLDVKCPAVGTIVVFTRFLNLPTVGSTSSGLIMSTSSLKDTSRFCLRPVCPDAELVLERDTPPGP